MLELDENEGSLGDVADPARAEHDALQGAPPLGHQGEAAFALVTQGAQQRVPGPRIDIQVPAAGRPFHRDVHACAGAFVSGIGQDRQVFQVGPQSGQDVLAGGGEVMGAAGQDVADPQRDAAGG